MKWKIRVYGRRREIPWKGTYLLLIPGQTRIEEDEEIVNHLRKFHDPQLGNGIHIEELADKKKIRSMKREELIDHAIAAGVNVDPDNTRQEIMKKLNAKN